MEHALKYILVVFLFILYGCSESDAPATYSHAEIVEIPEGLGKEASLALASSIGMEVKEEAGPYFLENHRDIPVQVLNHLNVGWGQTTSHAKGSFTTYVKIKAFAEVPIADDSFLKQGQMALKELVKQKVSESLASYNNKLQPTANAPAE